MDAVLLRRRLRSRGPADLLRHYACRALQRLGGFDLEHAFCLTPESLRAPRPDSESLRCVQLDAETLRRHAQVPGSGLAEVEDALRRGDWCFGVLDGESLLSHAWFSAHPTPLRPGLLVHFDPAYAYAYWAFTRTECRGRHLHALAKSRALEFATRRGLRGILSVVRADNSASLVSAARVGCRRVGSLLALGPARRPWLASSPGCRRFGLRLELA